MRSESTLNRPVLLVLASTYPRWRDDVEPSFVHELCRRLTNKFEVIALVPNAPGADSDGLLDGVYVKRFRYAPRKFETLVNKGGIVSNLSKSKWKWLLVPCFILGQYFSASCLIRQRHVSVIHAHWLVPQGLVARYLSRRWAIPYIVTSHGGDLFGLRNALANSLQRFVAAASSTMTVVSSPMRDEAYRLGLAPPKLEVIPMGADLQNRFTLESEQKRHGSELLFVGRLVPKKGLHYLLEALPAVLQARPEVNLTIIGFGPEEGSLRAKIRSLNLERNVNLAGAVSQKDLPRLYRKASIFIAPFVRDSSGNQEGLPVVLMEAIGCGCPVIVGDVAGLNDLLGPLTTEVCVNPKDTKALASNILSLLNHPEKAHKISTVARRIVEERFDWGTIARSYGQVLEQCIQ